MNPIRHIRRFAGALAGLAGALLAFAAAAPAALATGQPPPLPPIREKHPPLHAFLPPSGSQSGSPPTPSSSAGCPVGRSR